MEDGSYTNSLLNFEFDIIVQPLVHSDSESYEFEKGTGLD